MSNYNDPIIFNWHIDPQSGEKYSVQITDESQTVIKNRIFLNQIPDKLRGVKINGLTEKTNIATANDFTVDYTNGSITFHPSKDNTQFSISYYGRGVVMYPATRIWTELGNMGQVRETLKDVLSQINTIYTHPETHPASMITESTTKRFSTDVEKSTWSGKQDKLTAGTNVTITGTEISATDTTYELATASDNGLMPSTDKVKIDNIEVSGIRVYASTDIIPTLPNGVIALIYEV